MKSVVNRGILFWAVLVLTTGCSGGFDATQFNASESVSEAKEARGSLKILSPKAGSFFGASVIVAGGCVSRFDVQLTGDMETKKVPCEGGLFSVSVALSNNDGLIQIEASQPELNSKYIVATSFFKDTVAPEVQLVEPAELSEHSSTVVVSGFCEPGIETSAELSGEIYELDCVDNKFLATVPLNGPDGDYEIAISQTDKAGNKSRKGRGIKKDTTPPLIQVNSPVAGSEVATSSVRIEGTCERDFAIVISGDVTSSQSLNCSKGQFVTDINLSGGEGSKNLQLTHTDRAKNVTTINYALVLKRPVNPDPAPVVKITSPTSGEVVTSSSLGVQGTCSNGLSVELSGGGLKGSQSVSCSNGMFQATVVFSAGDGNKNFSARQVNSDGLSGSGSISVTVDTTAPVLIMTSPKAGDIVGIAANIQGTCEGNRNVTVSGDIKSTAMAACQFGVFQTSVTFSSGDGSKNLVAEQTDSAGNTGRATVLVVKDSRAPSLTFTSPAALSTFVDSQLEVKGACESNLAVVLSGQGLVTGMQVNCASSVFSATVNITDGLGFKDIVATQTDAAGNTVSSTLRVERIESPPTMSGLELYNTYCLACHGAIPNSQKMDATVAHIEGAINSIGAMRGLSTLTTAEITRISEALATPTTDPDDSVPGDPQPEIPGETYLPVAQPYQCVPGSEGTAFTSSRRLSKEELVTTYKALFGIGYFSTPERNAVFDILPNEDAAQRVEAFNNDFGNVDLMYFLADSLTQGYFSNSTRVSTLLPGCAGTFNQTQCVDSVLAFAKRGYRRPLQLAERQGLIDLITGLGANTEAARYAVIKVLTTPEFHRLIEVADLSSSGGRSCEEVTTEMAAGDSNTFWAAGSIQNGYSGDLTGNGWYVFQIPGSALPEGAQRVKLLFSSEGSVQLQLNVNDVQVQALTTFSGPSEMIVDINALAGENLKLGYYVVGATSSNPVNMTGVTLYNVGESYCTSPIADSSGRTSLSPYEVASRLSYQLIGGPPDALLMQAADKNELQTLDQLKAHTERLISTDYGREHFQTFIRHWLGLSEAGDAEPVLSAVNNLDPVGLREEMYHETHDFVDHLVYQTSGGFNDLYNSTAVFPKTNRLARVLGVSSSPNAVPSTQGHQGIILRPAYLNGPRPITSPIVRGVKLRRKVLCGHLPPPDPTIIDSRSDLIVALSHEQYSNREIVSQVTAGASCQGCHSTINPLGYVLENYNSLGQYRAEERVFDDNGNLLATHTIDSTLADAVIPGRSGVAVTDAVGLMQELGKSESAMRCFSQQLYRETRFFNASANDTCAIEKMTQGLKSGGSLLQLIENNVLNEEIFWRVVEDQGGN